MPLDVSSVSVVIPHYSRVDLLKQHLLQVVKVCAGAEFILVDDASQDESVAYVRDHFPTVRVIENEQNLRFGESCNKGVAAARGEIVLLLNNDVEPLPGLLEALLPHFADRSVFAVGMAEKTDVASNTVSGKACGTFVRGLLMHSRCLKQTAGETLWASGGSGAFRKSYWEALGGFDPLFKPAYDEDRDLCYRAMKRGYRCVFEPKALVIHEHETTNADSFGRRRIAIMGFRNQLLFTWKNTTDPAFLLQHIVWLGYHLVVTSMRSQGAFLVGFIQALRQWPKVWKRHITELREGTVSDAEILSRFS